MYKSEEYRNEEFGFDLSFDDKVWQGYSITTSSLPAVPGGFAIRFRLPSSGLGEEFFMTVVPTTQTGELYMFSSEGPHPIYLGRSDRYLFGYSLSQDPTPSLPNYECEVKRVVGTFRLIQ